MVRKATLKDLPALATMHIQSWHETYKGVLPDGLLNSLNQTEKEESWRPALTDPSIGTTVFIVEEDNARIIGLAASGKQRDEKLTDYPGEFLAVYVLNSHQKKGHGLHLMKSMCEDFLAHGIKRASLWVLEDNLRARPFYDSLGGEIVGRKEWTVQGMTKAELAYAWDVQDLFEKITT